MKIKRKITRILTMLVWLVLSAGLTVLLVAAIDIKNHKNCTEVKINITGAKDFFFLNNHDIIQIISDNGINHPVGKPIAACNLQRLETALKKNVWIKDAQLFFDNNLVLHVWVSEREPVARIFDTKGASFYVDSSGYKIPLGTRRLKVLPVFTGLPVYAPGSNGSDSVLISQIKNISRYILLDSFWMAQIAQVDITPQKTFDMVPTVGNHLIEFGDGEDYENKFNRLFVFYKRVLAQYGLDRYTRISVKYKDQVVGTKKAAVSRIDSLQALKNIQQMIDDAKTSYTDTAAAEIEPPVHADERKPAATFLPDSAGSTVKDKKKSVPAIAAPGKQPAAHAIKPPKQVPHATKPKAGASGIKPKAVMPKPHPVL